MAQNSSSFGVAPSCEIAVCLGSPLLLFHAACWGSIEARSTRWHGVPGRNWAQLNLLAERNTPAAKMPALVSPPC